MESGSIAELHPRGIFVRAGVELPRVCIVCGTTRRLRFKERVGFDDLHPTVVGNPVAMLAGALLVLAVRVSRRKNLCARIAHWRCDSCEERLREGAGMNLGVLYSPVAGGLLGVIVGFGSEPGYGVVTALAITCVAGGAAIAFRPRTLRVEEVREDGVVLSGVGIGAIAKLVEGAPHGRSARAQR